MQRMDHEDAVRAIFEEIWNRQDYSAADNLLADEFDFHIGGTSRTMTPSELREIVDKWHMAFADFKFEVHAVVSSDERAAVHATLHGTHTSAWNGIQPTGRQIRLEHMFFFRFEDDRIVAVWELLDRSELRRQLTDDAGGETTVG